MKNEKVIRRVVIFKRWRWRPSNVVWRRETHGERGQRWLIDDP